MGTEIDGVNGIIKNTTSDGDITIKGNDGGSEISALVLDMSAAGKASFNNDISLNDDRAIRFGAGDDLSIFHDGNDSYIRDSGTGLLFIRGSSGVRIQGANGEAMVHAVENGAVELYNDNSKKLETTSTGVDITGAITATAASTITTADNTDTLTLTSTDADDNSGPNLRMYRNSGSPADNDVIGQIQFEGRNDNSQDVVYNDISMKIADASDGTEDGIIRFRNMQAGTLRQYLSTSGTEVVINEDSVDLDFRVESNGQANMLFIDGGNNRVHVNGTTGTRELNVSGDNTRLLLYSTNNSTGAGQLQFGDDGNEQIGRIMYEHDDNNMTFHTNNTQFMELTSTGKIVLTGNTASSTSDLTSGGLHFHDASTSAGNIMPITFTPSATADRARAGIGFISQSASGSAGFAADIAFYARSAADGTTMGTGDEALRINSNHEISTKETDPDVSSGGLCLNQGSQDGNILTLKSSDIAHGMTDNGETDTYFFIKKASPTDGGVYIQGFAESDQAVRITGAVTTSSTGEATNQAPAVKVEASKKSGNSIDVMGADDNIFGITNHGSQVVLFKGDGEIFSDQSATVGTYDAYEDAQLVRAFDLNHMQGVINSKFDKFVQYNKDDLQKARLIGTDENGNATSFVSLTGMQRLHNGAIWQQYEKHQRLAEAVYEMAKETLGADKADAILKKHDIKLLN